MELLRTAGAVRPGPLLTPGRARRCAALLRLGGENSLREFLRRLAAVATTTPPSLPRGVCVLSLER